VSSSCSWADGYQKISLSGSGKIDSTGRSVPNLNLDIVTRDYAIAHCRLPESHLKETGTGCTVINFGRRESNRYRIREATRYSQGPTPMMNRTSALTVNLFPPLRIADASPNNPFDIPGMKNSMANG